MTKQMKAAYVDEYDNNDVGQMKFGEIDRPTPKDDEVLIKVAGGSFNPADRQVAAGEYEHFFSNTFPYVPGMDGAGVIVEIGDNANDVQIGDRVMSYFGYANGGGSGEYQVVKADNVSPAPANIPLSDAGTVPGAGVTAWQTVYEQGNFEPGQVVVVNGVTGGVGSFIVQILRANGGYVIGVDAAEYKEDALALGVDEFVDYRTEKVEDTTDKEIDLIINFSDAPNSQIEGQITKLVSGGIVVNGNASSAQDMFSKVGEKNDSFGDGVSFEDDDNTEADYEYKVFAVHPDTEALNSLSKLIEDGKVKPFITNRVAFEDTTTVHQAYLDGKNYGKIALIVNDDI